MKIALITANWNFITSVKQELSKYHEVKSYFASDSEAFNFANMTMLLDWADVAFFDLVQPPLIEASFLAVKSCKIVARLLGLGVFHSASRVNWQNIDHLICISGVQKQRLLEQNLANLPTLSVIPLGVNVDSFKLLEDKQFGYNITQVGNMLAHKRHYETIQLFKELVDHSPPQYQWHLHIHHSTDGSWRSQLQKEYKIFCNELVETLELDDNVTFYEYDPNWQNGGGSEFFKDKDIILSNSQMEGYHKTPLEGMACGLYPLINCWRGSDGIYPITQTFKTFSRAIEMMRNWAMENEDMKMRMAKGFREYVMRYHDEKKMAYMVRRVIENCGEEEEELKTTISGF